MSKNTGRPGQRLSIAIQMALPRLLSTGVLLLVWQAAVTFWSPALLPTPVELAQSFWLHLTRGDLLVQLGITLRRIGIAFSLSLTGGLVLGLLMGTYRRLDEWLDGSLTLMLNVPALVTIILCLMWFGLNEYAAIAAVVINKLPNMAVIFREGARSVDRDLLAVARLFRLSAWTTLRQVYLPQLYPYLLAATRTGVALVWKIVLVVELLGCSDGIGFQIGVFFQMFDVVSILAYTVGFVLVIYAVEGLLLRPWERSINRWRAC